MDYDETDFEYLRKGLHYISSSVIYVIFLLHLLVMQLVVAYIGAKNLMNCPKQPKIPIYLFVGGALGLVKLLQTLYDQWRRRKKENYDQDDLVTATGYESGVGSSSGVGGSGLSNSSKFADVVISLFLIVWFCFGNYWVFSIWKPNYKQPQEDDSQNWCSKDVYSAALIHISTTYILSGVFILVCLFLFLLSKLRKHAEDLEQENAVKV